MTLGLSARASIGPQVEVSGRLISTLGLTQRARPRLRPGRHPGTSAGIRDSMTERVADQLSPVTQASLGEDVIDVRLDRGF